MRLIRLAAVGALAVWTWSFATAPTLAAAADSVLHLPNLVFHEAGHVIFSPFGRFMTVAGGSLLQVLIPAVVAVALFRQGDRFGAIVGLWWLGENFIDMAPYIADARALQMVLLGGQTGAEVQGHDWEYLLAVLGWLRHDRTLGLASYRVGLTVMIGALVLGAMVLRRKSGSDQPVRAL